MALFTVRCQLEIKGSDCPLGDMAQNQVNCCQLKNGVITKRTEGLLLLSTWMTPVPSKSADLRPGFWEKSISRHLRLSEGRAQQQ